MNISNGLILTEFLALIANKLTKVISQVQNDWLSATGKFFPVCLFSAAPVKNSSLSVKVCFFYYMNAM